MSDKINAIAFPPVVDAMAKQHKGLVLLGCLASHRQTNRQDLLRRILLKPPGYNSLFTELAQCSSVDHYFLSMVREESPFKLGTVATSVLLLNPATDEETGRTPEACASITSQRSSKICGYGMSGAKVIAL
jgi:hypothetical protein